MLVNLKFQLIDLDGIFILIFALLIKVTINFNGVYLDLTL